MRAHLIDALQFVAEHGQFAAPVPHANASLSEVDGEQQLQYLDYILPVLQLLSTTCLVSRWHDPH